MRRRPRAIGQRWNANLVESVDVTPHARGFDLGGPRVFTKGRTMRTPDGLGKAIDVPGFETGTEGIEFYRVFQSDIAHHLAELCFGHQWVLTRHRTHVDVKITNLRCENWPVRTPAPDAADLHLRNDGASG